MPKSKRDKVVSLTKVSKKSKEGKQNLLKEVRQCVEEYEHLFVFSTENLRSSMLNKVRQHFKHNSRIFFGKNNLMAVAVGKEPEDEVAEDLHKISAVIKGQCGLMFTNENEKSIRSFMDEFVEEEFARAGTTAEIDVQLPAGLVDLPGPMEPQLRKLGLPTRLEKGKIELLEEFTVCKAGDQLSADQSRILKHFGFRLAEFRIRLLAHWSKGKFERIE